MAEKDYRVEHPERVISYFKLERVPLLWVTLSGIIYNIGLTAGPYFEGQLAQRLFDVINGTKTFWNMVQLVLVYLAVILLVQGMRCIKRFYVRRFANDTGRNMRHMVYNSLVHKSESELEEESVGEAMTRAVSDVDACAEGMRKFTTEVFDTGIALAAYLVMLFLYDWRLALIACSFTPFAYFIAEKLKVLVTKYNADYKKSAGRLNNTTMDRVSHAVIYRVFGCDQERNASYEACLTDYEQKAVRANLWENAMQPIYNIISMSGVIFIFYFGSQNVLGTGWTTWNIAAFTTFLSCFAKMALKSSKAAKLFNAVQKARVSWKRIRPFMAEYKERNTTSHIDFTMDVDIKVSELSFAYPEREPLFNNLSFTAEAGCIIGISGPVASGKSTLGRLFLGMPFAGENTGGRIIIGGRELNSLSEYEKSRMIAYMGHQPQLMSDTIRENISLGEKKPVEHFLDLVCLTKEVNEMELGADHGIGDGGICLSGGQQARLVLARTLYQDSKILILDDPFSALDRKTEAKIFANLKRESAHKIILLISHRLYLFPQMDQVIWMNGKETEVSSHAELIQTNKTYAQLYALQTAGGDLNEA